MPNQAGLIKFIILLIIAISILSALGVSIRSIVQGETLQDNFKYVWAKIDYTWDKYLARPAKYLWNDIFIGLLWDSFIDNMKRIKEGKSPDIIENAPNLNFGQ